MNEIKRRLMNGYVEMQDGTFAKEVNGELIQTSIWDKVDKHKKCLYFKDAKVESHEEEREECSGYGSTWTDEYIRKWWSCGCFYYEEHERCPGCRSNEMSFDCSGCRMTTI